MKRFGPDVHLQLNQDEKIRLSYRPKPGMKDLPPLELHPLLGVVLAFWDRGWKRKQIVEHMSQRMDHDPKVLDEIVESVQEGFQGHFNLEDGSSCNELDDDTVEGILDWQASRSHTPIEVVFPNDRAHFPASMEWVVSRYCNRKCVYCYQGAIPSKTAKDAVLTLEEVTRILAEGRRMGAHQFYLTGGEPLLREDIYDAICFALEIGMTPTFLTKQYIPEAAIERMASAGLRNISLSIDSLNTTAATQLTGMGNYADRITATVKSLVKHGIKVNVKAVLTPLNIDTMPFTLEKFRQLGVNWVGIDPYSKNLERHDDALGIDTDMALEFREFVATYNAQHPNGMRVTFSGNPGAGTVEDFSEHFFNCHVSTTALLWLPDGRVSKCDKQLPDEAFILGDLRTHSVHEVWNSEAMIMALKPPRERYKGTDCYDCSYFDTCHQRSRCFYDAFLTSGTLYGPQQNSCAFRKYNPGFVC